MGTHPKYSINQQDNFQQQNLQLKLFITNELAEMNRLTRLAMRAQRKLQILQNNKPATGQWTAEEWNKAIAADPLLQDLEDQA